MYYLGYITVDNVLVTSHYWLNLFDWSLYSRDILDILVFMRLSFNMVGIFDVQLSAHVAKSVTYFAGMGYILAYSVVLQQ